MENKQTFAMIQSKVKANKNQYNSFGKYHYRSAEDILEAVKHVINPLGFSIVISDEIVEVGGRIYVKATAMVFDSDNNEVISAMAYAREEESKKGMDSAQLTGATSSYARKYALSGLFGLDDNRDPDATNTHGKEDVKPMPKKQPTWNDAINQLHSIQDLKDFYNANEEAIMNNKDVMDLLTKRKQAIQNNEN